jgi:hypothetical protein
MVWCNGYRAFLIVGNWNGEKDVKWSGRSPFFLTSFNHGSMLKCHCLLCMYRIKCILPWRDELPVKAVLSQLWVLIISVCNTVTMAWNCSSSQQRHELHLLWL